MKKIDTKKHKAAVSIQAVARGYIARKNLHEPKSAEFLKLLALMNEDNAVMDTVAQLLAKEKDNLKKEPVAVPKKRNKLIAASPEASMDSSFEFSNPDLLSEQNLIRHNKKVRIDSGGKNHQPPPPAPLVATPISQPRPAPPKVEDEEAEFIEPPPRLKIDSKGKRDVRSFKIEEFVSPYNDYYDEKGREKSFLQRKLSRAFSSNNLNLDMNLTKSEKQTPSAIQALKSEFTKRLRRIVTESAGFRDRTSEKAHQLITHVQTVMEHNANAKKIEQAMLKRRNDGIVAIQDALLCIRGTLMKELPHIDRQWYIGIYPQFIPLPEVKLFKPSTTAVKVEPKIVDLVKEKERLDEEEEDFLLKAKPASKYSKIPEVFTGPQFDMESKESVQSAMLRPFNPESFQALSYYVHLSDIMRYVALGVVVYIETNNVALTNEMNTGTKVNKKGITNNATSMSQSELDERRKFVPAFFGTLPINQGAVFGPYGGRMHFTLTPNNVAISILPFPVQLLALDGLDLSLTFIPVALPSTALMLSFRSFIHAAPCYPCNLVDAESLAPIIVQWESFYGAVLCVGAFRQRILVSSRGGKESDTIQLLEYDKNGKFVGRVARIANPAAGEKVQMMFTGRDHIVCCTNRGYFIVLQEHAINPKTSKYYEYKPTSRDETPADAINNAAYWRQSAVFEAHPNSSVVCGCVLHYSNMDIFFTCDRGNNIAVHYFENGELIKNYMNPAFFDLEYSRITCMSACGNRLYIGDNTGDVSTVSLSAILYDGFIEYSSMLSRYIIRVDHIFTEATSNRFKPSACNSMAIYSMNDFLNLKNEDTFRLAEEANIKRLLSTRVDPVRYDGLEGHVLVIGGDDCEPVVKVLQPHPFGMREIVTLTGHKTAVTTICVDAAGRYIFTGSVGDSTILVWDGLTFTCEKQLENVNIGCMCLSHNALLVSSFKTPFLRMWKTKYVQAQSKQVRRADVMPQRYSRNMKGALSFALDKVLTSIDRTIAWIPNQTRLVQINYDAGDQEAYDELFAESHPDIVKQREEEQVVAVRSSRWCYSVLKGTQYVAVKSIIAPRYLEEEAKVIVNRWKVQYDRMDGSYDNSNLLVPLSKIEVSSPIHYSHRQNVSSHHSKSVLHSNSLASQSLKKALSFKHQSARSLKALQDSNSGNVKTGGDDRDGEADDGSEHSFGHDNNKDRSSRSKRQELVISYRGVSFRRDSDVSSAEESVRNITSNDEVFAGASGHSNHHNHQQLQRSNSMQSVKSSPKYGLKKDSYFSSSSRRNFFDDYENESPSNSPVREVKPARDLTNSYRNRHSIVDFHPPPVQAANAGQINSDKIDLKKARIKVLTDHDSENDSEDSETRMRRRRNTPKLVRLRAHFSSSDESESEFVRYFGNGKDKTRVLTEVEVVNKKLEAEQARVEKIRRRQKKLRPLLVFHLNDEDSGDDWTV